MRPAVFAVGQHSQEGAGEGGDIVLTHLRVDAPGAVKPSTPETAEHGTTRVIDQNVVGRKSSVGPTEVMEVADDGDGGLAEAGDLLRRQPQGAQWGALHQLNPKLQGIATAAEKLGDAGMGQGGESLALPLQEGCFGWVIRALDPAATAADASHSYQTT